MFTPFLTRRVATLIAMLIWHLTQLPGIAHAERVNVTFLLTCDVYKMSEENGRGGPARLAAVVKAERAKGGNLIYAHAGDAVSPCLMCGFDKGSHLVELMNLAPPDVFVPGNHEYDFGKEVFLRRMSEMRAPRFAANLRDKNGAIVPGFRDSEIRKFGPVSIGIVGLTAEDSADKSTPEDLRIAPVADTLRAEAQRLRDAGADLIVAVVHADRPLDFRLIEGRAADLILSGDDHDLRIVFDGKVAFAEAGQDAQYVTAVDLDIDVKTVDGKRAVDWWPNFRIIDTATVTPDPETSAKVKSYEADLARELDVPLAELGSPLDSRSATLRTQEAAIGNLVADAMRTAVGADIALANGGGIRANKLYPAGHKLTRRDVLEELPFGNKTITIALSGANLRSALENGFSHMPAPSGRFPQVSGMSLEVDTSRPVGERVLSVLVAGAPLDPAKTYTIAVNDFILSGKDGYGALTRGKYLLRSEDGGLVANQVMQHARRLGRIDMKPEGRIRMK